ncbi:INO80 complex subunit D-like protein [Carex littledalei]|uniref:KAT8 regulatory NSL complex subunit 2 n=1 Tax=Carex littledalei TaxID=544730 RepID=A0A833R2F3_9POAL|nr:INO80 complex subunit D-like protein [Carex littledalei]
MERQERSSPPSVDPVSPPNPSPEKLSSEEEGCSVLGQAAALSREEVLRRRSKRLQRLEAVYRKQYWALMEEMKNKHREYCWEHGKSPLEEEEGEDRNIEGEADLGLGLETGERKRCFFYACKTKAMPLTKFCHLHILSDPKQNLYKQCAFVKSSQQSGQSICGKPVLKAAMPSLCQVHLQRSQKGITQALKKAGLNPSASNNPVPKFSVLIAQSVRQIQARRIAFRTFKNSIAWKDGNAF